MTHRSRVVVFGAAHEDHYLRVPTLPANGETVLATKRSTGLGGKAANQAVAAATGGASAVLVAAIGRDDIGSAIQKRLSASGVDISMLSILDGTTSGLAVVTIDEHGENQIVVARGTASSLGSDALANALEDLQAGDVVVVQCEIPPEDVELVAVDAAARGATVVLNLAPYARLAPAAMSAASVVVLNRSEAAALTGLPTRTTGRELARSAAVRSRTCCLVTLGEDGAVLADSTGVVHSVPAEKVSVVDTTGAGDSYVGALAAELAADSTIPAAMAVAALAAASTVQHLGAQPAPSPPALTTTDQGTNSLEEGAT